MIRRRRIEQEPARPTKIGRVRRWGYRHPYQKRAARNVGVSGALTAALSLGANRRFRQATRRRIGHGKAKRLMRSGIRLQKAALIIGPAAIGLGLLNPALDYMESRRRKGN